MYTIDDIGIYIMSRDRYDYLCEMVDSVRISVKDELINISDNSSDEQIKKKITERYPKVNLIVCNNIGPIDHLNKILHENKKKFIAILHDDDYINPDFFQKILDVYNKNKKIVAVATNAKIITTNKVTANNFFYEVKKQVEIKTRLDLISRYTSHIFCKVAPFPSYVYNTDLIKNEKFNYKLGGNHSDVSFLVNILRGGSIIWINEPLYNYRLHLNNGGQKTKISHRLSLNKFLLSALKDDGFERKLVLFRVLNLVRRYNSLKKILFKLNIIKLIIIYLLFIKIIFDVQFRLNLINKIKKKIC